MPFSDKSFLLEVGFFAGSSAFFNAVWFSLGKKEHAGELTERQKVRRVNTNKICHALRSHKYYSGEMVKIIITK